jgi:hypothetical protein
MNRLTRAIFAIARAVAGRARAEWLDAMTAEAASLDGDSTAWALGCLWAAIRDRAARDWWFAAALLILPPCAIFWKATVFFWTSSLLVSQQIPAKLAVASWVLSPFPLPFMFALWRPGRRAYVTAVIGFLAVEVYPVTLMWVKFGVSPLVWLGPNSNWYKADPNVRIGPAAGLTLDLLVWLSAAWLGSKLRRRSATR